MPFCHWQVLGLTSLPIRVMAPAVSGGWTSQMQGPVRSSEELQGQAEGMVCVLSGGQLSLRPPQSEQTPLWLLA